MSEIDWLDEKFEQINDEEVKDGGPEELDADIDRWLKSQAEVQQQHNRDVRRDLDNILNGMFADLLKVYNTEKDDVKTHWRKNLKPPEIWPEEKARNKPLYQWDGQLWRIVRQHTFSLYSLLAKEGMRLVSEFVKGDYDEMPPSVKLESPLIAMVNSSKKKERTQSAKAGWLSGEEIFKILKLSWDKLTEARQAIDSQVERMIAERGSLEETIFSEAETELQPSMKTADSLSMDLPPLTPEATHSHTTDLESILTRLKQCDGLNDGARPRSFLESVARESIQRALANVPESEKLQVAPEDLMSILESRFDIFRPLSTVDSVEEEGSQ